MNTKTTILALLAVMLLTVQAAFGQGLTPSNWRNEQTGDWEIGFYDDFAIYDCKFWNYKQKTQSGDTYNIVLDSDGKEISVTVNNLFDIRNVVNVFYVTGNPEDNGYLTDPETQVSINNELDPTAYRELYAITLRNGTWNYSSPRTIRVSLSYNF